MTSLGLRVDRDVCREVAGVGLVAADPGRGRTLSLRLVNAARPHRGSETVALQSQSGRVVHARLAQGHREGGPVLA